MVPNRKIAFSRHPIMTIMVLLTIGLVAMVALTEFILGFTIPKATVTAGERQFSSITYVQHPTYRWALHPPLTRQEYEPVAGAFLERTEGVPIKLYKIHTDEHGFILPGPVHIPGKSTQRWSAICPRKKRGDLPGI